MSEPTRKPTLLIVGGEPKKRGRPPVDAPQRTVCVRVPAYSYERLASAALKRGDSMSSVVRQILLSQKFLKP